MSAAMAATMVAIGAVAAAWAAMIWKKHPSGDTRWIPFLAVVSGLCLGVGIGYLAGVNIIEAKVGYVPVWLILVAITGFAFFLEMKGWSDHKTRTPILGFLTALVLMLAVGHAVVTFSGNEIQNVRTTSNVVPDGAPKG
ncbi:MAG: hypothetical protein ACRDOL_13185 [Streptosporangiaceae bacterium]